MSVSLFSVVQMVAQVASSAVGVAIISGFGASAAAIIKAYVQSRSKKLELKLSSGNIIHLDIDSRLSPDVVSELVTKVIISDKSGDKEALQRAIDASHSASQAVRQAAAS